MNIFFNNYKRIYNTLERLNNDVISAHKKINVIQREYEDSISKESVALKNSLNQIKEYISRVNAFIGIAKTHTTKLIPSRIAIPFNNTSLSRIAVQINSGVADDPIATRLYTEATGQSLYLTEESARLQRTYQENLASLEKKFQEERRSMQNNVITAENDVRTFLHSKEFSDFIALIELDRRRFEIGNERIAVTHDCYGSISIGSIHLPFPIPKSLLVDTLSITRGLRHLQKQSTPNELFGIKDCLIEIPVNVDILNGSVFIAEYDNNSEDSILTGIRNIILSIARHYNNEFSKIYFIDPIRYNPSSLGCLSALCGEQDAFIDIVPSSNEQIRSKINSIVAEANIRGSRRNSSDKKSAVYVFHDFPQSYDSSEVTQIQQLCVNARYYGITIILTNNKSSKLFSSSNVLSYLQSMAITVTANSLSGLGQKISAPFSWYLAPIPLPPDIKRKFIDERPLANLSNDYGERVGFLLSPHYKKGTRMLERIPYGVNSNGVLQTLDFENSNFATFICGAARSGKSTLLHTLITGLIQNNHPDDIEIWLIDFKMTEFSRYIHHLPPHIRYIILDESPELVFDIIDRLTDIMYKRQNIFKGKWQKLTDVPKEKYMPAILVIIDEFSVMSQIIVDSSTTVSENYSVKLQMLLAKGAALGLHFIFASQGFTSGTRGLNDFSKKQIQQRVAMKTEYNEIKETLDLKASTDNDKAMMDQLAVHHTLIRIPADERGNHLRLSQVLYISDYTEQENMIDSISERMYTVPRYDPVNIDAYISKKPMIIDGNQYLAFTSKKAEMLDYYASHRDSLELDGERLLFIGEPRRMLSLFPINVINEFCENILTVAPAGEKMAASSIILSVARSLEMQNSTLSIWSTKKNSVFRHIKFECNEDFASLSELNDICAGIKNLKKRIQSNIEANEFYILLGVESIFADMSYQIKSEPSVMSSTSQITYEKRESGESDLLTQLAASLKNGKPFNASTTAFVRKTSTMERSENNIYDAREDLKYIFTNGPRLGYHFMLVFGTVGDLRNTKIDTSLFKHKIMFRTAKSDAMTIVGTSNASLISELEDHSFRYTNGLDSLSFRPYLHPGLSWNGWQLSDNGVINVVEEDEYLL